MLALQQEMNKSEESRTRARMNEAASIDLMMGEDKRKRQEIYRNMLQGQISYNKALNNRGNMTEVEKRFNKEDLKAYKGYDNT